MACRASEGVVIALIALLTIALGLIVLSGVWRNKG
jgi:hypothetical protein